MARCRRERACPHAYSHNASVRRVPCEIRSPTGVWLAYEQTELFLRTCATHFLTWPNGSSQGVILAIEHGRVAAAAHIASLYAAGMASTDDVIGPHSRPESIVKHAEGSISEDAIVAAARERAGDIGAGAVTPAVGALLCVLAKLTGAKAVVEVGTGAGVSGLWLLSGMREDGVLTTIDVEAEHQRLARESYNDDGIPPQRARTIAGAALDVLPRLTDGHYDLVFCDGDKSEYGDYLREALRLLKPGGIVAFDNALWHDRVADPAQRDAETVAIRELCRAVGDHDSLLPVLLPVG